MKKLLYILLALLMLTGCSTQNGPNKHVFYYPRQNYRFTGEHKVMAPELREDLLGLPAFQVISAYLQGPSSEELTSPFPQGTRLVSLHTLGDSVQILVSDQLAGLSGAPLILACACLGHTAMELTDTESAVIRCSNLLLDGKQAITVDNSHILLTDQLPTEPTESE